MAILRAHIPYYKEIFATPGFFAEPTLVFGYQDIALHKARFEPAASVAGGWQRLSLRLNEQANASLGLTHPDLEIPAIFRAADLPALLKDQGLADVRVIDLFDPRAELRYDMNLPVPDAEHERYATLIDIGSLEHVFDTRQCIENCLRMVRPGGLYFLHTCVKGYYLHGLHTFNPEGLLQALSLNGFEILYHRYSTVDGRPLEDPGQGEDVLIWLVGRKTRRMERFAFPQQGKWKLEYAAKAAASGPARYSGPEASPQRALKDAIRWLLPPVVTLALGSLRGKRG